MSKFYQYQLSHQLKDPGRAAMLSIIPGLGHIYEGQRRKGLLFLAVSSINVLLFLVIVLNDQMIANFMAIGNTYHIQPNDQLIKTLKQVSFGSTVSIMFAGLLLSFLAYAIQDAYDQASFSKRKSLYAEEIMEMPEATSSSYIIHFALMASCFILAMFFLVPPKPHQQVTEIMFIENLNKEKPIKQHSRINAKNPSKPSGKHIPDKQAAKQTTKQTSTTNQPILRSHPIPKALPNLPARLIPLPTINQSAKSASHPPTPKIAAAASNTFPLPLTAPLPAQSPTQQMAKQPTIKPSQFANHQLPLPLSRQGTVQAAPQATQVNLSQSKNGAEISFANSNFAKSNLGADDMPNAQSTLPISSGKNSALGNNSLPLPKTNFNTNYGNQTMTPTPIRMQPGQTVPGFHGIAPSIPRPNTNSEAKSDANHSDSNRNSPAITQNADFGPYMDDLQRRIKRSWFPPKDLATKRVVVIFKIHSDGTLSHLRLEKSSGSAIADQAALVAVQNAQPFKQLPKYAPADVDIQFTFDYNVFGGQRR